MLRSRDIQLFRKRLSENVHATIPKGIVVCFEITVLHRNFERMAWETMDYVSQCESEAAKVGLTATVSETVYWSYPILPFGIVVCTFFLTTFLEIAVYKTWTPGPWTSLWTQSLLDYPCCFFVQVITWFLVQFGINKHWIIFMKKLWDSIKISLIGSQHA